MKIINKIKFILSILFLIVLISCIVSVVRSLLSKTTLVDFCLSFMMLISYVIIICGDTKLIFATREENKKKENVAIKIILCGLGLFFLEGIIFMFVVAGRVASPL